MSNPTDIDHLFSQARAGEPYFSDQGFVSKVRSTLPAKRKVSVGQESAITTVATVLGCAVAYPFFPFNEIIGLLPTQFSITPVGLLAVSSLVSGLVYWLAENQRSY
jgi:hypothetical protein